MVKNVLYKNIREKTVKKRIPLSCQFDITYKCNLNCIHCYAKHESVKELGTTVVKKILDQLAYEGTLYLSISGGEIFTREDIFEILKFAREKHFAIRIITNGTLIDEDVAEKLAPLYLNRICVTIYSMNPQIHDSITQIQGSQKEAIKAIKILREMDLPVRINCIVMNKNLNEYNKVYEFSQRIGAIFTGDYQITPRIDGNPFPTKFQVNKENLKKVISDLIYYSESQKNSDSEQGYIRHGYDSIFQNILCLAGHNYLNISPSGDVFPCVQFPLKCGNLNNSSLKEIWHDSPQLKKISSLRKSKLPVCSKCDLINYCSYCPGYAYLEEKNLLSPPTRNCQEALLYKEIFTE